MDRYPRPNRVPARMVNILLPLPVPALFRRLSRVTVTAAVCSLLLAVVSPAWSASAAHKPHLPSAVIYVSPFGNDNNPGTYSMPIRTLTHARDIVRKRLPLVKGMTVYLAGGTYHLGQPLSLNATDSGRHGHKVLWTALPGTQPIISGAVRISGWSRSDPSLNI